MAKSSADDKELRIACEAAMEGGNQKIALSIRALKSRGFWGKSARPSRHHMAKPRVIVVTSMDLSSSFVFFSTNCWIPFVEVEPMICFLCFLLSFYLLSSLNWTVKITEFLNVQSRAPVFWRVLIVWVDLFESWPRFEFWLKMIDGGCSLVCFCTNLHCILKKNRYNIETYLYEFSLLPYRTVVYTVDNDINIWGSFRWEPTIWEL